MLIDGYVAEQIKNAKLNSEQEQVKIYDAYYNKGFEDGIRQGREDTKAECIEILNGIDKQVAEIVKGIWEQQDAK